MYIRLEEVLPVHQICNVECDLDPCLDGLDLLVVLGVVACEDDFSGSKLGGERSLGRSSCGNIGDLPSVHVTRIGREGLARKYLRTALAFGLERSSEKPTRGVFMMTSVTSECSAKRAWVMGIEARSCSLAKV